MAALCLAILTLTVFWRWLFAGEAFYLGDIGLYFEPNARFLGSHLRDGILPLWNPWILCGTPFVSNPQAALLYPTNVLHGFFSPPRVLMIGLAIHVFWAGLGCYFLARRALSLSCAPALLCATAWMLSGFVLAKTQFPNMVQAMAWLPWVLLCAVQLVQQPTGRSIAALGVVFGLQILASHAQISVFSAYFALLIGAWTWTQNGDRDLRRVFPGACGAIVLALGLSCAQWLPVFELLRVAQRQNLGLAEANRFFLPPEEITNVFWPHRFGDPMRGLEWTGRSYYAETACYAGLIPCVLALAGAWSALRGHRAAGFWLLILLLSAWLSFGMAGGLYSPAFYALPGLKSVHDPARLFLGASLALALLCGIGAQAMCDKMQRRGWNSRTVQAVAGIAIVLIAVDLGARGAGFYPLKPASEIEALRDAPAFRQMRRDTLLAGALSANAKSGGGRILRLERRHAVDVPSRGLYGIGDATYLARWAAGLPPNVGMNSALREASGYEPFARRDSANRIALAEKQWRAALVGPASLQEPLAATLSQMSVRLVCGFGPKNLPSGGALRLWKQVRMSNGEIQMLYLNTRFVPRARLSASPQPVQFLADKANRVSLEIAPSTRAQTLRLADTPHPGWLLFVDGRAAKWRAATSFRVVNLPPGAALRRIDFRVRAAGFSLCVIRFTAQPGAVVRRFSPT